VRAAGSPSDTPVLLLGFNRPHLMRAQIAALREVRPSRVYLAVDGPRASVTGERDAVEEVRACAGLVDWPCELRTRFLDGNHGCGQAVSGAIGWFLEAEPAGIVLEDDVRVSPDFHRFAAELLPRYADDERVWSITGICPDPPGSRGAADYRFTAVPQLWGWATWRRAWAHADLDLHDWSSWLDLDGVARQHGWPRLLTAVLRRRARDAASGVVDTWDTPFALRALAAGALHIVPAVPLATNVGVSDSPTHSGYAPAFLRPPEPLPAPIRHPATVEVSRDRDRAGLVAAFEATPAGFGRKAWRRIRQRIARS